MHQLANTLTTRHLALERVRCRSRARRARRRPAAKLRRRLVDQHRLHQRGVAVDVERRTARSARRARRAAAAPGRSAAAVHHAASARSRAGPAADALRLERGELRLHAARLRPGHGDEPKRHRRDARIGPDDEDRVVGVVVASGAPRPRPGGRASRRGGGGFRCACATSCSSTKSSRRRAVMMQQRRQHRARHVRSRRA